MDPGSRLSLVLLRTIHIEHIATQFARTWEGMMLGRKAVLTALVCAAAGIGLGTYLSQHDGMRVPLVAEAEAAGGVVGSPTGTAPDRYAYYPGTEALKADEIRVIACGTGMPSARRGQAATCFFWWRRATATSSFSILAPDPWPT